MAAITSKFVGNHAITWETMTPAPQQAPINHQTDRFDTFLKAELEKCKNKTEEYHGEIDPLANGQDQAHARTTGRTP